jgi:hypothetical protein
LDKDIGPKFRSESKKLSIQVSSRPDEVYRDKVRSDVKYFLRRLSNKFLCIVVVGDEVAKAYLINFGKYVKYRIRGDWK